MSTPAPGSTIPEAKPPKCPHCGKMMEGVDCWPYQMGQFMILSVACTHCKVLIHMGIMPLQRLQQMAEEAAGGPRVVIPQ